MKRILTYLTLAFIYVASMSGQPFFIGFNNKDTSDTTSAKSTLSQRALDRRTTHNIQIDSLDFPVNETYINYLKDLGLAVRYSSKWLNGVLVTTELDSSLQATLDNLAFVSYIHDLSTHNTGGIVQENADTLLYNNSISIIEFLGIGSFHEQGLLGEDYLISFFDAGYTGLDTIQAFKHVFDDNRLIDQFNFVTKDIDVYKSSDHGTNVASIVIANDAGNYIGIAPSCKVALYSTENISQETIEEEYNWLFAAERADSAGTDIINSSLGYYDFDNSALNHTFSQLDGNTAIITKAAKLASSRGILVVNSSGNSGETTSWPHVNFPSDAEEVLAVGAINFNGVVANFSSRGSANPNLQKPELVAPGVGVKVVGSNGQIKQTSGTSFSAPTIAGLSILLWEQNPSFTSQDIKTLMINNASETSSPSISSGYGYPILGIEEFETPALLKILKTEYFDLNGRLIKNMFPNRLYLSLSYLSDGSILREKVFFTD